MSKVFGEFIEEFSLDHDSLELCFTSSSRLIDQPWRNNRLSAYFVADYFSSFLAINENDTQEEERIKVSKDTISYISNELLENAIKFNEGIRPYQVKFGIHLLEDIDKITAVIFTKNSITPQKAEGFQALIEELLSADPNELYVQKIEKTAEDEYSESSGLGLLTIINDYSAKLGWKFESNPAHLPLIAVTTLAQVVV